MGSSFTATADDLLNKEGRITLNVTLIHAVSVIGLYVALWHVHGAASHQIAMLASVVLVAYMVIIYKTRSAHRWLVNWMGRKSTKLSMAHELAYHYSRRLRTCMLAMLVPYMVLAVVCIREPGFLAAWALDPIWLHTSLVWFAVLGVCYIVVFMQVHEMVGRYRYASLIQRKSSPSAESKSSIGEQIAETED